MVKVEFLRNFLLFGILLQIGLINCQGTHNNQKSIRNQRQNFQPFFPNFQQPFPQNYQQNFQQPNRIQMPCKF